MEVPKFYEFFLPVLRSLSGGEERSIHEIFDLVAEQLEVDDEARKTLVPSGVQTVHNNRVSWARTYLKKAGLVSSPRRSYVAITAEGKKLLQNNPKTLTLKDLEKYPGFSEFRTVDMNRRPKKHINEEISSPMDGTPSERFESSYEELQEGLREELLDTIMQCSWRFFEKLVVDLLINLGYGGSRKEAGEAFAMSNDEGIDGVIKEDKLGFDSVYVQAKRWKNRVGRPDAQKFAGALQGKKAKKGVLITTSSFSKEAVSFVDNIESKIILIDGCYLVDLMIESDTAVTTTKNYKIKTIDSDYFE